MADVHEMALAGHAGNLRHQLAAEEIGHILNPWHHRPDAGEIIREGLLLPEELQAVGERHGQQRAEDFAEGRLHLPVGGNDVGWRLGGIGHHRKGQRAIAIQAGQGRAMGAGHHHIDGQNGIEFGKGGPAKGEERGGIDGAIGRPLVVQACHLALGHGPAAGPKQHNLGIAASGIDNGNSTRHLQLHFGLPMAPATLLNERLEVNPSQLDAK